MAGNGRDQGFTLFELAFTMAVLGILLAIAVPSWRGYQTAQDQRSTAEEVVSVLRNAQARAGAEDRTYCVRFSAATSSWAVYRSTCTSGSPVSTGKAQGGRTQITAPSFTDSSGATSSDSFFYASGKASPGTVAVTRTGSGPTYTVTVEGLTGRVSMAS